MDGSSKWAVAGWIELDHQRLSDARHSRSSDWSFKFAMAYDEEDRTIWRTPRCVSLLQQKWWVDDGSICGPGMAVPARQGEEHNWKGQQPKESKQYLAGWLLMVKIGEVCCTQHLDLSIILCNLFEWDYLQYITPSSSRQLLSSNQPATDMIKHNAMQYHVNTTTTLQFL